MELFVLEGRNYLVVVDYYSEFFGLKELYRMTTQVVIKALSEIFSVFEIPDII